MKLKIIGSSSAGNAYVLDNGKEALLIECGCAWHDIEKSIDFDIKRLCGALISHEHGDHARHASQLVKAQINLYMSNGTMNAIDMKESRLIHPIIALQTMRIGNFKIMPFDVQHDAAEPYGFLIYHPETGFILFATDTYYLKYTFPGLNNIMLECNYEQSILDENVQTGIVSAAQRRRTMKSHMSFETCLSTLLANDLTGINNIILIHLSPNNSNADSFCQRIAEATGKNVSVARKKTTILFNKTPF